MSVASNSSFFNYYKNLETHLDEIGTSGQVSHDKVYHLIQDNLKVISSLAKEKLDQSHLSFSNEGQIVLDKWSARNLRSTFKHYVYQYSKYSDDIQHDLTKFTHFVNEYFKAYASQLDHQKALVLQTMLKQTVTGLKNLEKSCELQGLKKDADSIKVALKKLEKTLKTVEEKISQRKLTPTESLQNYIELLKTSHLSESDKTALLKNKLDSLKHAPIVLNPQVVKSKTSLVEEIEQKIKTINDKIKALSESPSHSATEDEIKMSMNEKEKLQNDPVYLEAKELLVAQQQLEDSSKESYLSLFEKNPYLAYKKFIDQLDCYPNEEDRSYLIANLLLTEPSVKELDRLSLEFSKIKTSGTKLAPEIKKLERIALAKSKLFEEGLIFIQARKKRKLENLEKPSDNFSKTMTIGKATANFIAAGGIVTLAFFVPQAAFGLPYVPSLLKAGTQEVRKMWNRQTIVEQNEIKKDVQNLIKEVRENPAKALENIKKQYDEKDKEGKKVLEFVNQLIELSKKGDDKKEEDQTISIALQKFTLSE